MPPSPLIDVLREDEDIEDVVALSGTSTPEWLERSRIPANWQRVELPVVPGQPMARMAVCGPLGNGEWRAAETTSVLGFTGWPAFYDVYRNVDRTLRDLNAKEIAVRVLPVPAIQWVAAIRSSGIAVVGDRRVWIRQSSYVAGSERPGAGRLIVHQIFVDAAAGRELAEDVTQLSNSVYQGYLASLLSGD